MNKNDGDALPVAESFVFTIKHVIRATNPDKKNRKHAHKIPLKPIENGIALI